MKGRQLLNAGYVNDEMRRKCKVEREKEGEEKK